MPIFTMGTPWYGGHAGDPLTPWKMSHIGGFPLSQKDLPVKMGTLGPYSFGYMETWVPILAGTRIGTWPPRSPYSHDTMCIQCLLVTNNE